MPHGLWPRAVEQVRGDPRLYVSRTRRRAGIFNAESQRRKEEDGHEKHKKARMNACPTGLRKEWGTRQKVCFDAGTFQIQGKRRKNVARIVKPARYPTK